MPHRSTNLQKIWRYMVAEPRLQVLRGNCSRRLSTVMTAQIVSAKIQSHRRYRLGRHRLYIVREARSFRLTHTMDIYRTDIYT